MNFRWLHHNVASHWNCDGDFREFQVDLKVNNYNNKNTNYKYGIEAYSHSPIQKDFVSRVDFVEVIKSDTFHVFSKAKQFQDLIMTCQSLGGIFPDKVIGHPGSNKPVRLIRI